MAFESGFHIGDYRVLADQNVVIGPDGEARVSPRAMEVLVLLAERGGEVVSRDDFSNEVWSPSVVTDDALTRCISELRRQLGDDTGQPRFIKTVPKRGYCLIAPVSLPETPTAAEPVQTQSEHDGHEQRHRRFVIPGLVLVAAVVLLAMVSWPRDSRQPPSDPSLAVLPFDALGTSPDDPYVDGVHHDLLTMLSRIDDLRVISSTSVRQYRDTTKTIGRIAEELGVAYILEGSVQRDGDRIRVNAQLIDAAHDAHLWANAWERTLTAENLFAIQAEIATEIAGSLEATIKPDERRTLERLPTQDLAAYTQFIRARSLLASRGEEALERAGELFRAAVAEDESFAAAWAGIADVANLRAYYGYASPESVLPDGRDAAMHALELDPDDPYALSTLGAIEMQLDHDGPAALEHLRRAHDVDPVYRGWLGWVEAVLGDIAAGIARTESQLETNPASPSVHWSLATLKLASGEPARARDLARRAQELSPGYGAAYLTEAQALLVLGDAEGAIERIDRALEYAGMQHGADPLGWLAAALARDGRGERAEGMLAEIRETSDWFALGLAHTGLGHYREAVAAFGQAEWNDLHTLHLRYHPFLDPLRDDPEFIALLDELDPWWGLKQ
ncbi:MAG: winged helix-turn-helix domain-containing protein [Wenzhouxiangellaceae bacterium]